MPIPLRTCVLMALLLVLTTALATESMATPHPCASVVDAGERLACYDAAFPPAADVPSTAVDIQSERERALREFGLNKLQKREREPERMRLVAPDRIEDSIASVITRATGERVVTLGNGQVWLLTEVTTKGQLKTGDPVVIREAAMGTYMLETGKRIALRARRIQ